MTAAFFNSAAPQAGRMKFPFGTDDGKQLPKEKKECTRDPKCAEPISGNKCILSVQGVCVCFQKDAFTKDRMLMPVNSRIPV